MSIYDMQEVRRLNRLTDNYFTAKNGYNFRKKLSRSQHKTLLRYLQKMHELTRPPFVKITPKRGEKRALYAFTGQDKYRKFKVAIVRTTEKTKAPSSANATVQARGLKRRPSTDCRVKMGR